MVSMKDIAVACGVSVATVSKALNDQNDIGEETKKEIKRIAKKMGYHPNSSARALKTNRSYNLGVLYMDAAGGLTHEYFAQVLEHFRNEAENRGYDITFLSNSKIRKDKMSYLEHSISRGMDGVMIAMADYKDSEVVELLQSSLPVVAIDYVHNGRISIMSNNIRGMQELLSYIYNQGHRQIAYIYGEESLVTTNRLSTYYHFLSEKGIKASDEYVQKGRYRNSQLAGVLTNKLLDLKNPPTCIVYSDDFSAIGGINAIKDRGLKIPQDISVAGYDGLEIAEQLEPKLTTYWQNTPQIGVEAAQRLINLIESPRETAISQYVIEGKLIEGGSVGNVGKFEKLNFYFYKE